MEGIKPNSQAGGVICHANKRDKKFFVFFLSGHLIWLYLFALQRPSANVELKLLQVK